MPMNAFDSGIRMARTIGSGVKRSQAFHAQQDEERRLANITGPLYTNEAAGMQQRNQATDQWRQLYLGDINRWQQGREGYAQALSDQFVGAANPAAETQSRDLRRRNTFDQARRGTRGGSADYDAQGRLQADYAQRLAQILAQGQALQRGQQMQDADTAQAWRGQAFAVAPGEQPATQSQLDAIRARMGVAGQMAESGMQSTADQQAYQQFLSQLMGGQLSTGARIINTAGQTGTGGPWAQALGQYLSGGR